jgi:uncharacterized protein DUF4328
VAGIVDAINVVLDLSFFPLLDRAEAGLVSDAEANAFDSIFGMSGVAQAAVILATAVAFLAWLSRIVENIPLLGGGQPLASPRAAIGWWFVPFANLVQPFRIVADAYRRLATAQPAPGLWLVTLWWLLWIVGNLVSNVALRVVLQENPTIADLRLEFLAYAVSDVLTAVAAVLAVIVVRRMQRWADDRAATASGLPVPNTLVVPPAAGA